MSVAPEQQQSHEVPSLTAHTFPARAQISFCKPAVVILGALALLRGSAEVTHHIIQHSRTTPEMVFFTHGAVSHILVRAEDGQDAVYVCAQIAESPLYQKAEIYNKHVVLRHVAGQTEELQLPPNFAPENIIFAQVGNNSEQLIALGSLISPDTKNIKEVHAFDGTSWTRIGVLEGRVIGAMTNWEGKLLVGGDFTEVNGNSKGMRGLASWDGTHWKSFAEFDGTVRSVATQNGNLLAGGHFTSVNNIPCGNIAMFSAATNQWSTLEGGFAPNINNSGYIQQVFFVGDAPVAKLVGLKIPNSNHAPLRMVPPMGTILRPQFAYFDQKWTEFPSRYTATDQITSVIPASSTALISYEITDARVGAHQEFSIVEGNPLIDKMWNDPQAWTYVHYQHTPLAAAWSELNPNAMYVVVHSRRRTEKSYLPRSEPCVVQKIRLR